MTDFQQRKKQQQRARIYKNAHIDVAGIMRWSASDDPVSPATLMLAGLRVPVAQRVAHVGHAQATHAPAAEVICLFTRKKIA
jgi:hypothetical protein